MYLTSQRSPGIRCRLGFPAKLLAIVRTKAGWKGKEKRDRSMGTGGGEGNVVRNGDLGAIIWWITFQISDAQNSKAICTKIQKFGSLCKQLNIVHTVPRELMKEVFIWLLDDFAITFLFCSLYISAAKIKCTEHGVRRFEVCECQLLTTWKSHSLFRTKLDLWNHIPWPLEATPSLHPTSSESE